METVIAPDHPHPAPTGDTIDETTPHHHEQDPTHAQTAEDNLEHVPQDDPHLPDIPEHEHDKHNPPESEPADHVEPADHAESAEHLESAEHEEHVDPADPADPVDSCDPADPADPVDSCDPAEPADTAHPNHVDPADHGDTTDPAGHGDATDPVDSADPSDPAEHAHPTDQADHAEPAVEETHHLEHDDSLQHDTTQHDSSHHDATHVGAANESQSGHEEHIQTTEHDDHTAEELVEHHEEVVHHGDTDEIDEEHVVEEQHPEEAKDDQLEHQSEHIVARAAQQAAQNAAAAAVAVVNAPSYAEHAARELNGGGGANGEGDGGRGRRRSHERYHASADQLKHLIAAFDHDPTPSAMTLQYLCDTTGMPMHNMVLWFKNRRARHKKANPGAVPNKTGRRSYVKSGIYSRGQKVRVKAEEHRSHAVENEVVTMRARVEGGMVSAEGEVVEGHEGDIGSGVEVERDEDVAKVVEIVGPKLEKAEGSLKRGSSGRGEHEEHMGRVKRRKYEGVREVYGVDNECHGWSGKECWKRCMSFFYKCVGGDAHPTQVNVAIEVAKIFFEGELQNGLTLTSAMQPLETIVGVLDDIMERTSVEEEKLSSGSRVVLREFVAQMRSGTAAGIELMDLRLCRGEEETAE